MVLHKTKIKNKNKNKNLSFDLRMRKDRETEIYGFDDPNPEIDALAMGSKGFFSLGF